MSVLEPDWSLIAQVVDTFYNRVQEHPSLKVPFARVTDWPHHKDRLTYFWWMILGGERFREESYAPVPKHFEANFSEPLLGEWLALFSATIRELVPEPLAALWIARARQIGAGLVIADRSYAGRLA
jgi:hemoglobin